MNKFLGTARTVILLQLVCADLLVEEDVQHVHSGLLYIYRKYFAKDTVCRQTCLTVAVSFISCLFGVTHSTSSSSAASKPSSWFGGTSLFCNSSKCCTHLFPCCFFPARFVFLPVFPGNCVFRTARTCFPMSRTVLFLPLALYFPLNALVIFLGHLLVLDYQICPGLKNNEIPISYDKHHKVSSLVKSHQNTQLCQT